jgi:hypothetical protein
MSRRLLALNVVLAIVSIALAAGIVRTLIVRRALPAPAAPRTATAPAPAPATENINPDLPGYAVIAARNLFNPDRSETAVATAPVVAKPILHGVVIDGAKSRAFLEDPAAKRIAGYSAGDMIGGGRIQRISDDRVVIARGSSRSCCVTLPSPGQPPSRRRRRSRPRQGRPRHHRRCHHQALRQRQSDRANPLPLYLRHPLQEF